MLLAIPSCLEGKFEFENGEIILTGELNSAEKTVFESFYIEYMQEKWMRFCISDISYKSICEKVGFDLDSYKVPLASTEDENGESPFRKLSVDELNFIVERRRIREEFKKKYNF